MFATREKRAGVPKASMAPTALAPKILPDKVQANPLGDYLEGRKKKVTI